VTSLLEHIPQLICTVFIGHLDPSMSSKYVDAATLSAMFTNVSSLSMVYGLTSALDTLCSQAFGAGKHFKMGIYLQSGMIITTLSMVPIFFFNWYASFFLQKLGQDKEICNLAQEFSRYSLLGIPFLFIYELFRKLLQAQNIFKPMVYMTLIQTLVTILSCYFLIYHTSLGFLGGAIGQSIGYVIMPFLLIGYYAFSSSSSSSFQWDWWPGWQLEEASKYIRPFMSLGIPGMLMMIMEWWAYEIMTLLAGILTKQPISVSAHAVVMNISGFFYMLFYGVCVAGETRIGNCLGANQPKRAKLISQMTLCMVFSLAFCMSLGLVCMRHWIPQWLINDPESIELASHILLFWAPFEIFDGLNCVMQGIFRGAGRQHIAASTNAVAYYLFGMPLGAFLAFKWNMGVTGLWIGFGSGMAIAFVFLTIVLTKSSWRTMAQEAETRASE
jgi:MATE family multidrug resistance protein